MLLQKYELRAGEIFIGMIDLIIEIQQSAI